MNQPSSVFEKLHPGLQRWIYRQGWTTLRPIQERAFESIMAEEKDVILAAATASGKTEAAFFPILTALAAEQAELTVGALCVSPLKALINDQFDRLEELGQAVDVPVHRWHGDVPASARQRLLRERSGLLLITPESLEAFFVRRAARMPALFQGLRYLIVDELHSFIGSERGRQLQSLLHRLELLLRRRIPRIALSATLGDLTMAADFLRPGDASTVVTLEDKDSHQEVKLQVRGYRHSPAPPAPREGEEPDASDSGNSPDEEAEEDDRGDNVRIAGDLFRLLRGGHHLVFANRRAAVEVYADRLRRLCEQIRVPNEFWPHHGSLSKEIREEAERRMNNKSVPATLIATTTLELGIDVGSIESVVQIGTPPSVAALKQRLGRSGRQGGAPSVLRIAILEPAVTPQSPPPDTLHLELFQAVAMVELLLEEWVEPPPPESLHLSTLVQQVLSVLAQHGGADARTLWLSLCSSGPFSAVDQQLFGRVLRSLAENDLILQDHTGALILGLEGERLVDHYEFYAAFSSPEEYRLVAGGKTIGKLPIVNPLFPGALLIFAGRRWRVLDVVERQKVIELTPTAGGRPPAFVGGGGPLVLDRVRDTMRVLYRSDVVPRYLDKVGKKLLEEGRSWYRRLRLDHRALVPHGDTTFLFSWFGDRVVRTVLLLLSRAGLESAAHGPCLVFDRANRSQVLGAMRSLLAAPWPSSVELAADARNKQTEKFHLYLDDPLLATDYATGGLDLSGSRNAIEDAVALESASLGD